MQAFVVFVGQWAENLATVFDHRALLEDASHFKTQGPVWHQSDRQAGRIPERLRHLDTDATWGYSAYHGWVYGYSLHLTCNGAGFPKLIQTDTASVDESHVLAQKTPLLFSLQPEAVVGDNAYFKAMRVRRWAKQGVILLTPATRWQKGRYAQAYHRFIQRPPIAQWLSARKTAIEPVFDLVSKVLGTTQNQKQLPVQGLAKAVISTSARDNSIRSIKGDDMSENKTRPTDQDVIDLLNSVEHQTRREDGFALLEMMQEVTGFDDYEEVLADLGKHKIGKACLYVNKLADVDEDVLRSLIRRSYEHMKETNQQAR